LIVACPVISHQFVIMDFNHKPMRALNEEVERVRARHANHTLYPPPPSYFTTLDSIRYYSSLYEQYYQRTGERERCNEWRVKQGLPAIEFPETHISVVDVDIVAYRNRAHVDEPNKLLLAYKRRRNALARLAGEAVPYPLVSSSEDADASERVVPPTVAPVVEIPIQPDETQPVVKEDKEVEVEISSENSRPEVDGDMYLEDYDEDSVSSAVTSWADESEFEDLHASCARPPDQRKYYCWKCDKAQITCEERRDEKPPVLVTTSAEKAADYVTLLERYPAPMDRVVTNRISEIQGDIASIAAQKAISAKYATRKPVLVEDTSLCVQGLAGLPGPYVKHFDKNLDPHTLANLYKVGSRVRVVTVIAYAGFDITKPVLFMSSVQGTVVPPSLDPGYAFDRYVRYDRMDRPISEYPHVERVMRSPRRSSWLQYATFAAIVPLQPTVLKPLKYTPPPMRERPPQQRNRPPRNRVMQRGGAGSEPPPNTGHGNKVRRGRGAPGAPCSERPSDA